jgi:hypothetical protein
MAKWLPKVAALIAAVHVTVVLLSAGATDPHGALGKSYAVGVLPTSFDTLQTVVAPAPPVQVVVG